MSSGGSLLPADVANMVEERIHEEHLGGYEAEVGFISELYEDREFGIGQTYHKEVRQVADTEMDEIDNEGSIKLAAAKERRVIITKRRKFAKAIKVPKDLVDTLRRGTARTENPRAVDTILDLVTDPARIFGQERAQREEETAANLFNFGGFVAGHAPTFDNTVEQGDVQVDPSGPLGYDSAPFFSAAGQHVSAGGTAYSNALLAAPMTPANVTALMNLVEDSNAYNELDRRAGQLADTLLVPPALRATAESILANNFLPEPGVQLSSFNPRARLRLVVWPYLTNPAAYFVGARSKNNIRFWRTGAPRIEFGDKILEDKMVIAVIAYWGYNEREWRGWASANAATA